MPDIKLKARIQNKYETLENWNKFKKGEFIPLKGEVCYGIDKENLYQKIGDGETDFVNLPWNLNQSDWSEYDYTSPQFVRGKPGGYWQAIDTTEKSTAFALNYTDDGIDLSSDLGVFGGLDLAELDERLLNFPTSFDLVVKNNTFEVAKFTDIKINKPLPFVIEPGLEVYYQGNIYYIVKDLMGLTSKEEINSLGIYDTGELYGFILIVTKEEPQAGITFWLSPEFKTATSVEFNIYECDFVPLPINYTNLDISEFVGRFDETYSNTKFGEIFNDYVNNQALGEYSHAEGKNTKALGEYSHAEGRDTCAYGMAHAEGSNSIAYGDYSHAEGASNGAYGHYSHAEGAFNRLSNSISGTVIEYSYIDKTIKLQIQFSNGQSFYDFIPNKSKCIISKEKIDQWQHLPISSNIYDVVEEYNSTDSTLVLKGTTHEHNISVGDYFYIFDITQYDNGGAFGEGSHSEGEDTLALGKASHSEGYRTIAASNYQHVQGKYNVIDLENKYAMIIGNGENEENPSNAMAVDWEGTVTANNFKVISQDENGDLVQKSLQGDMEQSDPEQIDYIKNRTHYKYYEPFDKFVDISEPNETTQVDGLYKYNTDYNYQLDLNGEYIMTLEVIEPGSQNVLHTMSENLLVKTAAELDLEFNNADITPVLFSAESEIPIFMSGIEITEEGEVIAGQNYAIISATTYYDEDMPIRLTLEGPGFTGKIAKYKKLGKEFLDLEEKELYQTEYLNLWENSEPIEYKYTIIPIDNFENKNVIDFPDWIKTEEEGRVYLIDTDYNTPDGYAVLKGMSLASNYQESVNVQLDPNLVPDSYGTYGCIGFGKDDEGEIKARRLDGLLHNGMEIGLSIPLREYLNKGYRELEIQFSGNAHNQGDVSYNPYVVLQSILTNDTIDLFDTNPVEDDILVNNTCTECSDITEEIQNQYQRIEGSIPFPGVQVSGQENLILGPTKFNGRMKLLFSEKYINCSYEYKLNPIAYRTDDSPHTYCPLQVSDYSIISVDSKNEFNINDLISITNYLYLLNVPCTCDTKILGIWRK